MTEYGTAVLDRPTEPGKGWHGPNRRGFLGGLGALVVGVATFSLQEGTAYASACGCIVSPECSCCSSGGCCTKGCTVRSNQCTSSTSCWSACCNGTKVNCCDYNDPTMSPTNCNCDVYVGGSC